MEMTVKLLEAGTGRTGLFYSREALQSIVDNAKYPIFGGLNETNVDPANASHVINKLYVENDCLMAVVGVLDTMQGKALENMWKSGIPTSFKAHGKAQITEDDVVEKFDVQSIRAVSNPASSNITFTAANTTYYFNSNYNPTATWSGKIMKSKSS